MRKEKIHPSSGNVFIDLGFAPDEAAIPTMRAELMVSLRETIAERQWTQAEAAKTLGIAQSRVSDLVRGKWDKFSLDMLVNVIQVALSGIVPDRKPASPCIIERIIARTVKSSQEARHVANLRSLTGAERTAPVH